jgi:hypothetical protein
MKRSGWVPGKTRNNNARRKNRARTVNQILRESYRLYTRDRATLKAVKQCLG